MKREDIVVLNQQSFQNVIEYINQNYSYHNVLFVGISESEKRFIESKKIQFLYTFENSQNDYYLEEVDLVFIKDCGLQQLKNFSFEDKPLIIFINNYVSIFKLNNIFNYNFNIKKVFIGKEITDNKNRFIFNFINDFLTFSFIIFEKKLNKMYFNDNNYQLNVDYNKIIRDVENKDFDYLFEMYYNQLFYAINLQIDVINDTNSQTLNDKQLFFWNIEMQCFLNIYKVFFTNANHKNIGFVNIEKVGNNNCIEYFLTTIASVNFQKFWFITKQFKHQITLEIESLLSLFQRANQIIIKSCFNQIYSFAKCLEKHSIKKSLKEIIKKYDGNSLLKIIYYFGLIE